MGFQIQLSWNWSWFTSAFSNWKLCRVSNECLAFFVIVVCEGEEKYARSWDWSYFTSGFSKCYNLRSNCVVKDGARACTGKEQISEESNLIVFYFWFLDLQSLQGRDGRLTVGVCWPVKAWRNTARVEIDRVLLGLSWIEIIHMDGLFVVERKRFGLWRRGEIRQE